LNYILLVLLNNIVRSPYPISLTFTLSNSKGRS
jgi:hypothetical protein